VSKGFTNFNAGLPDSIDGDTVKCSNCNFNNKDGYIIQGNFQHVNPINKNVPNEKK